LVQKETHEDANINWGMVIDESMQEELRVTVIATGFGKVEEKVAAIPSPVASTVVNRFKRAAPLSVSAKENRDIPAFMRRVKVSERFDELKLEEPAELNADEEERFDIPTFLRKQAD
jgi:cell division protein FtsZ